MRFRYVLPPRRGPTCGVGPLLDPTRLRKIISISLGYQIGAKAPRRRTAPHLRDSAGSALGLGGEDQAVPGIIWWDRRVGRKDDEAPLRSSFCVHGSYSGRFAGLLVAARTVRHDLQRPSMSGFTRRKSAGSDAYLGTKWGPSCAINDLGMSETG